MEAEKKARELVDKFWNVALLDSYEAKQCARVAVDELISHSRITAMIFDLSFDESTCYWNKVKKEIEKL